MTRLLPSCGAARGRSLPGGRRPERNDLRRKAHKIARLFRETMGRPPTLRRALVVRLSRLILEGALPTVAARALGIPERKYHDWMRKGRADALLERDSIHPRLLRVVDISEAQFEASLVYANHRW